MGQMMLCLAMLVVESWLVSILRGFEWTLSGFEVPKGVSEDCKEASPKPVSTCGQALSPSPSPVPGLRPALSAQSQQRSADLLFFSVFSGTACGLGAADQDADVGVVRYRASDEPEHAQTPSQPFFEDLFTTQHAFSHVPCVSFVQDLNETIIFNGQWCSRCGAAAQSCCPAC